MTGASWEPGLNVLFEVNAEVEEGGLGNIASTIMLLLGFEKPSDYLPPLIRLKR